MAARPVGVIQFFGDYDAESPLWFAGMFDPADLALDPSFRRELIEWASHFNTHMHWERGWSSDTDRDWYETEGLKLADRLARELGNEFAVNYEGETQRLFRSRHEPLDEAAALAARKLLFP